MDSPGEDMLNDSSPLIQKKHLDQAAKDTRASIPLADRLRYERIYADFSGARAADFTAADSEFSHLQRTALV